MIRFVDLGTQINEWERLFAFWNTVNDCFERFSNEHAWSTKEEFILAFDLSMYSTKDLNRRLGLIPENWPDGICGACENPVVKP